MNRIFIALAALIPLLCEAAKLTHYADSSLFVTYPANLSTNAAPEKLPRQLDEAAIPGGGPASNRIKRISFDVACAMAGTVDAFVQRNVAASLFGTPDAEGFLLGTNYFTGAQYATTNVICTQLFFDHVMNWPNQDTWVGPDYYGQYKLYSRSDFGLYAIDYNMSYTNAGTGHTSIHVWTNTPTRRLFADKYLRPVEDMLSFDEGIHTDNYWIPSLQALAGITGTWDALKYWCHYPPCVLDQQNNVGRIFFDDSSPILTPPTFGWGSSAAESSTYDGSTSDWISDPNDLVSYWGNFFPEIPKIFEDSTVTEYDDPRFRPKNLGVGIDLWNETFRYLYELEDGDEMMDELQSHLDGTRKEGNAWSGEQTIANEPYTGTHGFDLMAETCGTTYTNFPSVDSRRIVYTPFEFCNSFLGLIDTYYVCNDAMPVFVYDRIEEHASVSNGWKISFTSPIELVFDNTIDKWVPVVSPRFTVPEFVSKTTNYIYSVESVRELKEVAYITPTPYFSLFGVSTNVLAKFPRSSAGEISTYVHALDLYDKEGYIWVRPNNSHDPHTGDWIDVVIQYDGLGEKVCETLTDALPDLAFVDTTLSIKANGTKVKSERTDFDRTLMSNTNSLPCCHPLPINGFNIGPEVIHYAAFLGAYLATNDSVNVDGVYSSVDFGYFKLFCGDAQSAIGVDSLAISAENALSSEINRLCLETCQSDSSGNNLAHLIATWDGLTIRTREIADLLNEICTNGFVRTFHCDASYNGVVKLKVDRSGEIWVQRLDQTPSNWVRFQSEPDFLNIYITYTIEKAYLLSEERRRRKSCYAKGSMTSIAAVKYDFKTMKREE